MDLLYAGLDVSDKKTHICLVDGTGKLCWQGVCATDPEALSRILKKHAPFLGKVIFETGALSCFGGVFRSVASVPVMPKGFCRPGLTRVM